MIGFLKDVWCSASVRRRYSEFKSIHPIPVSRWIDIAKREGRKNALLPVRFRQGERGYIGLHAELKGIFENIELGTWAIDSKTMDFFWEHLSSKRVNTILEFGSGSSTCLFAAWMRCNNPEGRVISVDQNIWAANETRERLRMHCLETYSTVLVMDRRDDDRYSIDIEKLKEALSGRAVEMLFVDGPAGCDGCRDNTLPDSLSLFAEEGDFFVHDALRDGELDILLKWDRIQGVEVAGVMPYGNGLGVGKWRISHLS